MLTNFQQISNEVIKKRFGPSAEKKKDMLGSFISRGLDADEVEMEISISLFVQIQPAIPRQSS